MATIPEVKIFRHGNISMVGIVVILPTWEGPIGRPVYYSLHSEGHDNYAKTEHWGYTASRHNAWDNLQRIFKRRVKAV